MKNKLISMCNFVLEQNEVFKPTRTYKELILNYAQFLKQPLELWMFVPCKLVDSFLVVLNLPIEPEQPYNDKKCDVWEQYLFYINQYQQAKERCLFEKSKYGTGTIKEILKCSKIIEDLITCSKLDLTLTQTAIKQLGL